MLADAHQRALEEEFSSTRALEHVVRIGDWYRAPGSSGYHAAIDYVLETLNAAGVRSETLSFALGDGTELLGERTPLAWEPRSAEIELVSPHAAKLGSWDDAASSIAWWTPPTPPGGVELEVVDVGQGLDDASYAGADVAGKAVLIADSGENFAWFEIAERAERHGAAAILTNYLIYQFEPWRTREAVGDAVQQLRLRPKRGNLWAISLNAKAFDEVRAAAADGAAVVRLAIDTEVFEGTSRSVLATVGPPDADQHVIFVAHVTAATQPGANCASGVALMLELAAALERAIAGGRLPAPRRAIHFLFGNEDMASTSLAGERPELIEQALCAISVCSVAHAQDETKSALILSRSPDSYPTFMNDLGEALIGSARGELRWPYRLGRPEISRVSWKPVPYTPWSDNVAWTRLGVPALLCMSLPDRYFHTHLLTHEKISLDTFAQAASVLGSTALTTALAGAPEADALMRLVASAATSRLARASLAGLSGDAGARERVEYLVERDVAQLRSVLRLLRGAELDAAERVASELEQGLRRHAEAALAALGPAEPEASGDDVVPVRTDHATHGLTGLGYDRAVALVASIGERDEAIRVESLQLLIDELWRLSDGSRSLSEITRIIRNQFDFALEAADMRTLADTLEAAGCLRLGERVGGGV